MMGTRAMKMLFGLNLIQALTQELVVEQAKQQNSKTVSETTK
jgi:hypothetical protein